MSSLLLQELDRLEKEAAPYARQFTVRAKRFIQAFLPALIVALWAARSDLTVGIGLSVALSVAASVLTEQDPGIPWSSFLQLLDRARNRAVPPPSPSLTRPTS